jgi:hypothetical protein
LSLAPIGVSALVALCAVAGCSVLGTVFAPAEYSENYALAEGTVAEYRWQDRLTPAPGLVDGSPTTTVETSREIRVFLPESKAIRRVVARNSNYETATLYVGGRGDDEWHMAGQIKNNTDADITFQVNASTDRIRIRVGKTHDDRHGGVARRVNAGDADYATTTFVQGKPRAGEIEIYGYRPRTETP